jgi:hypothetical protein
MLGLSLDFSVAVIVRALMVRMTEKKKVHDFGEINTRHQLK